MRKPAALSGLREFTVSNAGSKPHTRAGETPHGRKREFLEQRMQPVFVESKWCWPALRMRKDSQVIFLGMRV